MGKNKTNQQQKAQASDFVPAAPGSDQKIVKSEVTTSNYSSPVSLRPYIMIAVVLVVAVAGFLLFGAMESKQEVEKSEATKKVVATNLELALDAFARDDTEQARIFVGRALEASPEDFEALTIAFELSRKGDPAETKQLANRMLEVYKKQTRFDDRNTTALQNWTAAGLAEDAGNKSEAIKYYRQVITKADRTNDYENDLLSQSSQAIERLQ